jgi:hypothetical protein
MNGSSVPLTDEVVLNEGDVRRPFTRLALQVIKCFQVARSGVRQRTETGPLNETTSTGTVDERFLFRGHFALVGEFKPPGVIQRAS